MSSHACLYGGLELSDDRMVDFRMYLPSMMQV